MGNVVCCANDSDTAITAASDLGELKKPQLFGQTHKDDSDSDSDKEQSLEEILRELVPKIRHIK